MRYFIAFLLCLPAFATDTGWLYAGTITNISPGNTSWSSPSSAAGAPDGVFAQVNINPGQHSYTLRATNFTWPSIPADATINGIEARVYRKNGTGTGNRGDVEDEEIKIVLAGVVAGTNKASAAGTDYWYIGTLNYKTWGSSSDLWGNTLTPASFTSTTGFAIKLYETGGNYDMLNYVDSMEIKVYYTPASSGMTVKQKTRGFFAGRN